MLLFLHRVTKGEDKMKKVYMYLYHKIFSDEVEIRERLFRVILFFGSIILLLGTVETVIVQRNPVVALPYFVVFIGMVFALYATLVFKKCNQMILGMGLLLNILVLPEMFLSNGGVMGGSAIWLLMGILYNTLMFDSKVFIRMQLITVFIDCILYAVAYLCPECVKHYERESDIYLDSLFSLILVGFCVGAVFKYQIRIFRRGQSTVIHQKEEIEKLVQSKNKLFANVSHEIRTPINSILLLDEMILRESKDENIRDYGMKIKTAGKVLLSLINDVLDFSQMEMGKMQIHEMPYNTKEMFTEIIDIISVRTQEKKLDFQVDISGNLPLVLYGDQKRIEQILFNILTNAVKYTEQGSVTLRVDVEDAKEKGIQLIIVVADTGIGIRKEDLNDLYNIFKRVDESKNWKIEGSGLGLSITKQLVDLLGGNITVDSIYKKGTVFTVSLFQKVVDREGIGNYSLFKRKDFEGVFKAGFQAPKARILIVDDNALNASLEAKLLEDTKMQIDLAQSGEECLSLTMKKAYNIILIDYQMSHMNGGETLLEIRRQQNGLCREARIILLTAASITEASRLCDKYGFDGYVEKPVQGEKLEQAILSSLPESYVTFLGSMVKNEQGIFQRVTRNHRRKRKLLITTDCVSDISEETAEKLQIKIMYLYIKTKHGRFMDTKEISLDYIDEYMTATGQTAYVESASVEKYEEFFSEALEEAENVIHISMAKGAGDSYQNAVNAARSFEHVKVVESGQISCGQGLQVLYAAQCVAEGMGKEEVLEKIAYLNPKIETTFVLKDTHGMIRSGAISEGKGRLLGVLGAHPMLYLKNGKLKLGAIFTGDLHMAWKKAVFQRLMLKKRVSDKILVITYAGCSQEEVKELTSELSKRVPFETVVIQKASFSSTCNAGNHSIGFSYLKNIEE